jgi:thioredoxin-like negative regulator of GroEL
MSNSTEPTTPNPPTPEPALATPEPTAPSAPSPETSPDLTPADPKSTANDPAPTSASTAVSTGPARKPPHKSKSTQPVRRHTHNRDAAIFTLISAVTLAAATAGLAALWPAALAAARAQSTELTQAGRQTSGGEALTDYQLAAWLDPNNQAAYTGLAREQILAGRADDALANLSRAGEGSEVMQLKVRTLLELGRYNEAANIANGLTSPDRTTADIALAGLAFALANRPPGDITALMDRVTAPEALQTLQRAQSGNLPLAAELYATGLLRSSSAILTKLPSGYQRDTLLARINIARHTPESLAAAIVNLQAAITANPADITARTLLAQAHRDLGQADAAAAQDSAIAKHKTGRP